MTVTRSSISDTYRDRAYGSYVSDFKGQPNAAELELSFEKHARFLDSLIGHRLRPMPASVLEVGCGPGAFLFWARRAGASSVYGIDLSSEQVSLATAAGLPAGVDRFQDYMPLHRGEFDLVAAFDVIEHLTRDEGLELLDLAYSSLKPGGRVILATPNGAAMRPGPVWTGDLTHETLYSPASIQHALRLAGFDGVRVGEIQPPALTMRSRVRRALWQLVRVAPMILDIVETGGASVRVYSRNMLVEARRPADV